MDYSILRSLDYVSMRLLHGKLLSVCENNQAWPGAPEKRRFKIRVEMGNFGGGKSGQPGFIVFLGRIMVTLEKPCHPKSGC
jgi:hypothetical protein